MADNLRDVTIIARGGLYTNEDALTLAGTEPGSAIRMTNFEVSQFGGYRRINGYEYYDAERFRLIEPMIILETVKQMFETLTELEETNFEEEDADLSKI